ncbi:MAG: RNA polymerase sigma factor SigM [Wenzhouxiangellaceae bacterium]
MNKTPDHILQRAAAGDHQAFRQLVLDHSHHVQRLALRLTMDPSSADDVVQETFLKVYRKLGSYRRESSFHTWLHRITVNTAMDYLRRKQREEPALPPEAIDSQQQPQGELCVLEQAEIRERATRLLRQLSPLERSALSLRHFEGYSIREIGSLLQLGDSACKQAIFRAVKKLRHALEPWS